MGDGGIGVMWMVGGGGRELLVSFGLVVGWCGDGG